MDVARRMWNCLIGCFLPLKHEIFFSLQIGIHFVCYSKPFNSIFSKNKHTNENCVYNEETIFLTVINIHVVMRWVISLSKISSCSWFIDHAVVNFTSFFTTRKNLQFVKKFIAHFWLIYVNVKISKIFYTYNLININFKFMWL